MSFNSLILIWFDNNKRNLPWRTQTKAYQIWLSEIILQQTRVAQGTQYYERFCKSFPTIERLAAADEQEVLKLWQGLGYYSRARNLHQTAQYIVNDLKGEFPDNYQDLLKLKGVGSYTAAAIASISFHQPVPAIDGNALRVFSRYFDVDLDISKTATKNYFFELAKEIIDHQRPGDFNQAVMELGATICLPKNPNCESCPLSESCAALSKNKVDQLPVKTKIQKQKKRILNFLEISDGRNYLMCKRIKNDIWKNLFTFPLIEGEFKDSKEKFLNKFVHLLAKTHTETHILTHQKLEIDFWKMSVKPKELKNLSEKLNAQIYSSTELSILPVPKPVEKYLKHKI